MAHFCIVRVSSEAVLDEPNLILLVKVLDFVLSFLELLLELFLRGLLEFVLPLLLSGMLLVLQPLRCCFCGLREPYFLSFGFSPA